MNKMHYVVGRLSLTVGVWGPYIRPQGPSEASKLRLITIELHSQGPNNLALYYCTRACWPGIESRRQMFI